MTEQRHQDILLHRRLSNMLPLTSAGGQRFCYGDKSSHGSWVQYKMDQEAGRTGAMYRLLESQHKLPLSSRHAVGGKNSVPHAVSFPLPAGESCVVQTMPSLARLNGISGIGGAFGTPTDEGSSALGRGIAPVLSPSPQPQSESITVVHSCAPPVGGLPHSSLVRCPAGDGVIQGNHDNRCLPIRLRGGSRVGTNSERHLGPEAGSSHKNILDLWAVFYALKHFLTFLHGRLQPKGLRAHSSWAMFNGVPVQDICAAASWSTPHTFERFYRFDVSGPSLAHAALEAKVPESL